MAKKKKKIESVTWTIEPAIKYRKKSQKNKKLDADSPEKTVVKFRTIAQKFVTGLGVIWKYTDEIGRVAQNTSLLNIAQLPAIVTDLKKRAKQKQPGDRPKAHFIQTLQESDGRKHKIKIPIFESDDLKRLGDCFKNENTASRLLNETVLQQMVNAWELVLASLLGWKYKTDPDSLPKERPIECNKILNSSSIDELHKHVIDNEIMFFLKNNSTKEQIKYFKDEFKVDLKSNFALVDDLCEIVLRRHAIVHAGGTANGEYFNRVKKLKQLTIALPSPGECLADSDAYVKRSWSILFAAGVILIHLLAVGHSRDKRSKDDEDIADNFMINAAFNNIKNRQYHAAKLILSYALGRRLATPKSDLMVRVNLAQAYKWNNEESKCKQVIAEHDWQACSADFRTCVAALNDDSAAFFSNLKIASEEESIGIQSLYEWPIFQAMRKKDEFCANVKQIYGVDFDESQIESKPTLFDFESKSKLSEILDKYRYEKDIK